MSIIAILVTLFALIACSQAVEVKGLHYGYVEANAKFGVKYFYWMYAPKNTSSAAHQNLIIWLTGGPGCSSSVGNFFENGPQSVASNGVDLVNNQYSWNENAYVLYLDQPAGVGFSPQPDNPKGYARNESQVAADFVQFMQNFYTKYPDYHKLKLTLVGESFGGHYVPAIGGAIVAFNKKAPTAKKIPLVAIGVGNGLVDPLYQWPSVAPFIWGHNLMTKQQLDAIQSQLVPPCVQAIENGEFTEAFNLCNAVVGQAMQDCAENRGKTCNIYNYAKDCNGPLCYDMSALTAYLNNPSVQSKLGVNVKWNACNGEPYSYLVSDFDRSYRFDLPILLKAGLRVVIYEGVNDIICNFYGASSYINKMKWPYQSQFVSANNNTWFNDAGTYRTVEGISSTSKLTYVTVANAGHMVPHDQPSAAFELINKILFDEWKQ